MSVKQSANVWELEIDPTDKLILLALADHADHDGNNVYPGNDLLCAKTGLSQPTITAKLKKFVTEGILEPQTTSTPGRGNKRGYTLHTSGIRRRQYFIDRDEEKERRKVKPASTFSGSRQDVGKVKPSFTFQAEKVKDGTIEKVKADEQKVKADEQKVKADEILHDKERARHEPSIEPSEETSWGNRAPENLGEPFDSVQVETQPFPRAISDALNDLFPAEESNQSLMMQLTGLVMKFNGTAADVDRWLGWMCRRYPRKSPNYHEFKSLFPLMMKEGQAGKWLNGSIGARFTLLTYGLEPEMDVEAAMQNRVLAVGHWLDEQLELPNKEAWKSRNYTPGQFQEFWRSRFPNAGKPTPEKVQQYWEEFETWLKQTK